MLYCKKLLKMGDHNHEFSVVKNYTLTALMSFSIMFILFISLAQCHGPFVKNSSHHSATSHGTEHHNTEHKESAHH